MYSGTERLWNSLYSRHAVWVLTAGFFAALTTIFLILSLFDGRLFNGVSVWSKPFKFSLSFIFYFITLAWFSPLLPEKYFTSLRGKLLTGLPVVCAGFEISYIALQAGLGQSSHFNNTTPLHSLMYDLMGVAAVLLVAVCLWMAIVIARYRRFSDPFVLAVVTGLVLTFFLGGLLGGYMSSQSSHWVGVSTSDANGIWFFHWARDGGDLRIAHFFGIHAMQVIPAIALSLKRVHRSTARIVIIGLSAAYVALTIATFMQATAGRPFIS